MSKKCANCQKEIPASIKIDGKKRNLCKRKYCFECSPWGSKNTSKIEELEYNQKFINGKKIIICIDCNREKVKHKGGRCHECCKIIWNKTTKTKAHKFKAQLVALAGGCCKVCGYKNNYAALEFHHRDPSEKKFELAQIKHAQISNKLLEELNKCDLLCSNCHRKAHQQSSLPKYINPTENPNFDKIKIHNLLNITHSVCATCDQLKEKKMFPISCGKRLDSCKVCKSSRVIADQRKNKAQYVNYLGGKCNACGHKDICGLEFHHKNPVYKKFAIASKKFVCLNDEIRCELNKCELLCGNCHREFECPNLQTH